LSCAREAMVACCQPLATIRGGGTYRCSLMRMAADGSIAVHLCGTIAARIANRLADLAAARADIEQVAGLSSRRRTTGATAVT